MKMSELVSKTIAGGEVALANKNFKDAVFSVNDILPDASGNVEITGGSGGGSSFINVDDFAGATDAIKIQAAIDFAETNIAKIVMCANRVYELNATIHVKPNVELRAEAETEYRVNGNFRVFEIHDNASLIGGFAEVKATNFTSSVIYLNGRHQYGRKTRINGIKLRNSSGVTGGTGIHFESGGGTVNEHIHYVNTVDVRISLFNKGIHLQATAPVSAMAWVNGNRFDKITIDECIEMIHVESSQNIPYECSGNSFTNLQIQPSTETMKIFTISASCNVFTGMCWDVDMIPHGNHIAEFNVGSSSNRIDIEAFPDSRVLNNGQPTNMVGNGGIVPKDEIEGRNWNDLVQMGTYKVQIPEGFSALLNHPLNALEYGILTVLSNNLNTLQLYVPHDSAQGLFIRSKFGSTDWTDWAQPGASGGGSAGMGELSEIADGVDWNTVITMGTHRINESAGFLPLLNHPPATALVYGILLVFSNGSNVTQLYVPHDSEQGFFLRSRYGLDDWTAWAQPGAPTLTPVEEGFLTRTDSITGDWNLAIEMGTHRVVNPNDPFTLALNQPVGASTYGILNVFVNSLSVSQMYIPHSTEGIYIRSKFGTTDWTSWKVYGGKVVIESVTADPVAPVVGHMWLRSDL